MNHPELSKVISELCKKETPRNMRTFTDIIRLLVKTNAWVYQPLWDMAGEGYSYCTAQLHDMDCIVMFSEDKYIKTGAGISIASTGIQGMINLLQDADGPDGLAINPFTSGCHCIISKQQLPLILTGSL